MPSTLSTLNSSSWTSPSEATVGRGVKDGTKRDQCVIYHWSIMKLCTSTVRHPNRLILVSNRSEHCCPVLEHWLMSVRRSNQKLQSATELQQQAVPPKSSIANVNGDIINNVSYEQSANSTEFDVTKGGTMPATLSTLSLSRWRSPPGAPVGRLVKDGTRRDQCIIKLHNSTVRHPNRFISVSN